ncbi:MAG TPA: TetR/AcrR family transcriptional regulator C-terminal domain-containing protein [Candidatus Binatia bacterium]|jgi:AcrR family transcriptional regulator
MGRPPKISRERLQSAALALVDAHGLEGLTMRALADAVGTAPMTLYNHVEDRADLEALVVDAVLTGVRRPSRARERWQDEVRDLATAMWRAVRAHPAAIPLILVRRSRSRGTLELSEALLAALARSRRSRQRLLVAFRAVTAMVMGFAQVELAGPLALRAGEPSAEVIERMRALPKQRFAGLVEIATAARRSSPEREFAQGLDILIAGLETDGARRS